eukprot:TRINITY_DN14348_c0_g1_i1.p1 TRINITY_DN14348_c0_g1~~TRINITY_DN14348_c0_g1_i1.p1  ORF type:complete len:391 (+),score=136.65 TRINITY_DN14348_c0_g1_i1:116-1288(+)
MAAAAAADAPASPAGSSASAPRKQQELSDIIKAHHRRMRERIEGGEAPERVWQDNAADGAALALYAGAMHELGERWESAENNDRVEWTVGALRSYFWGDDTGAEEGAAEAAAAGGQPAPKRPRLGKGTPAAPGVVSALSKPLRRAYFEQHQRTVPPEELAALHRQLAAEHAPAPGKRARVLDVGSCYNPIVRHPFAAAHLEVTAVDLCPAPGTAVKRCDFCSVAFRPAAPGAPAAAAASPPAAGAAAASPPAAGGAGGAADAAAAESISEMAHGEFDAVVFSLVLSYIPSAALRLQAVRNAFRALRPQGLLVIQEPRTVGKRAAQQWLQPWRETIEALGMARQGQAIMGQLVCVTFRKSSAAAEPAELPPALEQRGLPIGADRKPPPATQ